jgi:hypothetical protein
MTADKRVDATIETPNRSGFPRRTGQVAIAFRVLAETMVAVDQAQKEGCLTGL